MARPVDAAAVSDNYRLMAARCETSPESVAGYRGWWWAQVALGLNCAKSPLGFSR